LGGKSEVEVEEGREGRGRGKRREERREERRTRRSRQDQTEMSAKSSSSCVDADPEKENKSRPKIQGPRSNQISVTQRRV
jgi:hypothetical protein